MNPTRKASQTIITHQGKFKGVHEASKRVKKSEREQHHPEKDGDGRNKMKIVSYLEDWRKSSLRVTFPLMNDAKLFSFFFHRL